MKVETLFLYGGFILFMGLILVPFNINVLSVVFLTLIAILMMGIGLIIGDIKNKEGGTR